MKTPRRFQSQLLVRRSYKPERSTRRKLGITFRSTQPVEVSIARHRNADQSGMISSTEVVLSG